MQVQILKAANEGKEKPTHIMYAGNLSWTVLQRYLRHMTECGLLFRSIKGNRSVYHITGKGQETIAAYAKLEDLFGMDIWENEHARAPEPRPVIPST